METTRELTRVVEQAAATGTGWSAHQGATELVRLYGRDGAQRLADDARNGYQLIMGTQHPRLAQQVKAFAEAWGNDPGVLKIFRDVYAAFKSAPPTDAMAMLNGRRAEQERAEAAAMRAEGEQLREREAREALERAHAHEAAVSLAQRRWNQVTERRNVR
jgi:hypothetical protein